MMKRVGANIVVVRRNMYTFRRKETKTARKKNHSSIAIFKLKAHIK